MTRNRRIAEGLARGWAEYRLRRIQRLLRAWAWAGYVRTSTGGVTTEL